MMESGERPPFNQEDLRRILTVDAGPGSALWGSLRQFILSSADAEIAWEQLLAVISATQDPEILCFIGVVLAEPFLQLRWQEVRSQISDAGSNANFRRVLSCVMLSDLPDDFESLISRIAPEHGSAEDIGSAASDSGG